MAKYRNYHPYHERYRPVDGHMCSKHPYYSTWSNIVNRCCDKDSPKYADYGGRGITICDRWRNSFEAFVLDMGHRPSPTHTVERIDNDKGYYPNNCKWATRSEQMKNRRTFKNNKLGVTGIVSVPGGGYKAQYNDNGTRYNLGQFRTVAAAKEYRDKFVELLTSDRDAALKMTERRARYDSTTGIKGITPHADGGFLIRKTINKERKYLGYRKTFDEAKALWNEHN